MLIAEFADGHFQGGPMLPWIACSWHTAMDVCIERKVDVALFAGDVFEDPCHALGRDASAGDVHRAIVYPTQRDGAPDIYAIPGNHDLMTGHAHALEFLRAVPGWTIVDEACVMRVVGRNDVTGGTAADVVVGFLPWEWNSRLMEDPAMRALPVEEFEVAAQRYRLEKLGRLKAKFDSLTEYKILCGHAEINGAVNRYRALPDGQYHVFDLMDILDVGADSLTFGHYHKRQSLATPSGNLIPVYVGGLVQLDHGESGNPAGFSILNTDNGEREWIELDCPHFVTLSVGDFNRARNNGGLGDKFREGMDIARLRGEEAPMEKGRLIALPRGMTFEKIAPAVERRVRADGVDTDSDAIVLLDAWMVSQGAWVASFSQDGTKTLFKFRGHMVAKIREALTAILDARPVKPHSEVTPGGLEKIHRVRLWNVGPHVDTNIDLDGAGSQLVAYVGETGVGKSLLLEAPVAAWTGEFPFYDANLYDLATPGAKEAGVEFEFSAQGRRWLARRVAKISGGKTSRGRVDCDLFEVVPGDIVDLCEKHVAGPREKDFAPEMRRLLGDRDRFLATVFQSQLDAGGLTDMEPEDAMAFMRRLVGAARFDEAAKHANDVAKAARKDLDKMQGRVESLGDVDAALATADAAQVEAERHEVEVRAQIEPLSAAVKDREATLHQLHDNTRAAQAWQVKHDSAIATGTKAREEEDAARRDVAINETTLATRHGLQVKAARIREVAVALAHVAEPSRNEAQRAVLAQEISTLDHGQRDAERDVRQADADAKAGVHKTFGQIDAILRTAKTAAVAHAAAIASRREAIEKQTAMLGDVGCADVTKSPGGVISTCPLIEAALDARDEDARLAIEEADLRVALLDGTWFDGRWTWGALPLELAGVVGSGSVIDAWKRLHQQTDAWPAFADPAAWKTMRERIANKQVELAAMVHAAAIPPDVVALREEAGKLGPLGDVERALGQLDAVEAALPARIDRMAKATAALQACAAEYRAVESGKVDAPGEAAIQWAAQQVRDAERAVATHNEATRKAASALGTATAKAEAAAGRVVERDALLEGLNTQKRTTAISGIVEEFLAPKGVPQLLIDLAVPQVNDAVAEFMAMAIDGYSMRLDTQFTTPGGTVKEGLFVLVTGPQGERPIKAHSGGQRNLFRKVLRMGFGAYEAQRHGAGHRVYCTDEPTIGLSEGYVRRFLDAICAMTSGRFDQVIIVEHSPAALAMVPTRLLLTQESGRVVVSRA